MKILHLIFPGLGTDPNGDCCGMRTTALKAVAALPEHEHKIAAFPWDGNGGPTKNAQTVADTITQYEANKVIIYAHSFGCSFLNFLVDWSERWNVGLRIDLALCYDPCHHWFYFGHLDWDIRGVCLNYFQWYQHSGLRPLFVVGTPFVDPSSQHTMDVTCWTGPTLGHMDSQPLWTGIPNDERIRAASVQQILKLVT